MTCRNRIEVFKIANPVTKNILRFPTGLISTAVNYRDGQLAMSVIKSGSPHILVGNLNNDSTLDLTERSGLTNNTSSSSGLFSDINPQWSPKGDRLAFIRNQSIWTINADGTNASLLFSGVSGSQITHLQYAPRGNQILVTLGKQTEQNLIKEFWLINSKGSKPKLLFQEPILTEFALFESDYTYPASFSPDGNSIIYTSDADGKPNIWRISIPDGKREKLTRAGAIYPNYLPDADILIYTSLSGNRERIAVLDLTGKKNEQLLVK
jgi:Tol biopolymer transport system component